MKTTPGPWRPIEDAQGICGLLHPDKPGVAVAWFSSSFSPQNGYVGEAEHEMGRPERQANAHLIAAAPDLLEALESLKRNYHSGRVIDVHGIDGGRIMFHELWDKVNDAIAKAKGET